MKTNMDNIRVVKDYVKKDSDEYDLAKNINFNYFLIPGNIPITINNVYKFYTNQLINNKENYQETKPLSQLSTISDGEGNIINNNINNIYAPALIENKNNKNENNNLEESIKKGLKNISDIFNRNHIENCTLTFAGFYHCELDLTSTDEYYLDSIISVAAQRHKMKIQKKEKVKDSGINNINSEG